MPVDQQEMAANYGWALAVLRSSPELSKLFDRAVGPPAYTQTKFTAELRNTKWYKTHSESVRQALVLQKADPAEYNRRVQQAAAQVSDSYYALTGKKMSAAFAKQLGQSSFMYGFTDPEIQDLVGNQVSAQKLMLGGMGGTLGEAERQIRSAADDYGLDFSDSYIGTQLNNIARQKTDTTAIINNFRQQAKSKYAAYADQLDQGATIKDIAEPYRQVMAKTLEISDQSITTNDKNIQNALTYRPPAQGGKPSAPAPMALWQFETQLKNDPRWDKTKGAQDSIMAAGRQVLQDMGLFAGGSN